MSNTVPSGNAIIYIAILVAQNKLTINEAKHILPFLMNNADNNKNVNNCLVEHIKNATNENNKEKINHPHS